MQLGTERPRPVCEVQILRPGIPARAAYCSNRATKRGRKTIIATMTARGSNHMVSDRLRCWWEINGRRFLGRISSVKTGLLAEQ